MHKTRNYGHFSCQQNIIPPLQRKFRASHHSRFAATMAIRSKTVQRWCLHKFHSNRTVGFRITGVHLYKLAVWLTAALTSEFVKLFILALNTIPGSRHNYQSQQQQNKSRSKSIVWLSIINRKNLYNVSLFESKSCVKCLF